MSLKLPRNQLNGWIVASVQQPSHKEHGYHKGWSPAIDWCKERFDEKNWRYVGEGVFEFRCATNHMMFLLAWS